MGVASIQTLVTTLPGLDNTLIRSIVGRSNATVYEDAQFLYPDEKSSPGIDNAFGLHAFFAVLWLLTGFLQMGPILRFSLIIHRKFGYVSVAVFISHMLASINNLIFNEAEHHWLNRAGLGSLTIVSTAYMILSIKAVKQGDIPAHTDYAIRSFLYSIEGAGTIRQVAYLQWLASPYVPSLLAGPGPCQLLHLGKATHCGPAYFIRGIFTRLLTLYYICVYELSKKKFNIKKVLYNENVMAVSCTLVFLCVDTTVMKLAY